MLYYLLLTCDGLRGYNRPAAFTGQMMRLVNQGFAVLCQSQLWQWQFFEMKVQ